MPLLFEKLVQEDLNIGTDTVWVQAPGGGQLLTTRLGMHSLARGTRSYDAAWTPGVIAAGSKASTTVSVPDAAVADRVLATHDKILAQSLRIAAHVSAAGTANVVIHNPGAAAVTVPAGTVSVLVFPALVNATPAAPTCVISAPSAGPLGGLSAVITVVATDAVYGIANVKIWWQYCPSGVCGASTLLTTDTSAPYQTTWTFPSCGACPEDRFKITAESESNSGGTSGLDAVDVRLTGRGC